MSLTILKILTICFLGAGVCYQMGLFDPEAIPGFVLSQEELWSQWYVLVPAHYIACVSLRRNFYLVSYELT